ncbi:MAG: hypothetical protein EXR72_26405 [Myxococcales bacterium]|nr:hypothetical protein [Myxococcales bacterium]
MTLCHGGRWTVLCESDGDCPTLTRCSWEGVAGARPRDRDPGDFGRCERVCRTSADCGDFGLGCDGAIGLCAPSAPAGREGGQEFEGARSPAQGARGVRGRPNRHGGGAGRGAARPAR